MKIKCPVALCEWEGKTHDFWRHIEEYKIQWKDVMDSGFPREESHERWANWFYKSIWNNPDLTEKTKWTNIAVAYVNQMKSQSKMGQHKKLSPDYDIFAMLMGYVMHVDICFVLVVFLPALEMLIFPAFLYWHVLFTSSNCKDCFGWSQKEASVSVEP